MFGYCLKKQVSTSAKGLKIHLKKEYPLVFNYLHPRWQVELENKAIPEKSLLLWKCSNGPDHEWKASIKSVVDRYKTSKFHNPCPFCSSQFTSETNSLQYRFPYVADEWNNELNTEKVENITYGTTSEYFWKCRFNEDHNYQQSPNRRTDLNILCPHCSSGISPSDNLDVLFPELALEWDTEKNEQSPSDFPYRSKRIVHWKCSNNHKWKDSIANRTLRHHTCPVCKCNELVSLSTRCPSLVQHWDYKKNTSVSPDSISIGSRKRVYWICSECQKSFSCVLSQMFTSFIANPVCLCPSCKSK